MRGVKILNEGATTTQMVTALRRNGHFVVENYLSPQTCAMALNESNILTKSEGRMVRRGFQVYETGNYETLRPKSGLRWIFDNPWMTSVYSEFTGNTQGRNSIILERCESTSVHKITSTEPGLDRVRALDFIFYLSDVDMASGPLSLCNGSNEIGKKIRDGVERPKADFRNYGYSEAIIAAKKGTLIVLDSNTFNRYQAMGPATFKMVARSRFFY